MLGNHLIAVVNWVKLDIRWTVNHKTFDLSSIVLNPDDISIDIEELQTIVQFAFLSLGFGAARFEELYRIKVVDTQWSGDHVYYSTFSHKKASVQQMGNKASEHRLSFSLSRIVLLFHHAMNQIFETRKFLFDKQLFKDYSVSFLVSQVFETDSEPNLLQIRHFITSLMNVMFPRKDKVGMLVSESEVTERSGHTQWTGES